MALDSSRNLGEREFRHVAIMPALYNKVGGESCNNTQVYRLVPCPHFQSPLPAAFFVFLLKKRRSYEQRDWEQGYPSTATSDPTHW